MGLTGNKNDVGAVNLSDHMASTPDKQGEIWQSSPSNNKVGYQ
jgi:hypothetical protein